MKYLKCAAMTVQEAYGLAKDVLLTADFDIDFDCGRVCAVERKDGLQTDLRDIVAKSGWKGFGPDVQVFCATGYQYGFEDKWDILAVEE